MRSTLFSGGQKVLKAVRPVPAEDEHLDGLDSCFGRRRARPFGVRRCVFIFLWETMDGSVCKGQMVLALTFPRAPGPYPQKVGTPRRYLEP